MEYLSDWVKGVHNNCHGSGGSRISRSGGRGPRSRGCGLPRQLRFENFVCQNERIGTLKGARAGRAPLDPPVHGYSRNCFV